MKRFFDIITTLIGLIIFTPLLLLISIAIIVFDGFPIIFVQPRLGKNKQEFDIIKFRTMKIGD